MQDALRAVKEAWGAERWAELDSSTKTKLWTLNMKQEDGWRPPALPGAAPEEPASVTPEAPPSAAPEVPPSVTPEEPPSVTPEPAAEDGAEQREGGGHGGREDE